MKNGIIYLGDSHFRMLKIKIRMKPLACVPVTVGISQTMQSHNEFNELANYVVCSSKGVY